MDSSAQDRGDFLVSVIVVTYQSAAYISYCLESLTRSEDVDIEIIVVDNNSSDDTVVSIQDRWPDIKVIANDHNQGFAKACNTGVVHATGDFLVFLNPDCIVGEDSIAKLISQAQDEAVGLVGPLLIDGSGKLLPESARHIPTSAGALMKVLQLPFSKVAPYYAPIESDIAFPAPVLCGACMCVETSKYKQVGGFDESYFMYGEDVDLSVRFIKSGYQNICESGTSIVHFKGESADKGSMDHHHHFYRALELYHTKHGSSSSTTQSLGVSLLSGGLARQRYLFFHFRKWSTLILDAMMILGILLVVQFAWSLIKSGTLDYYGYFRYVDRYLIFSVIWLVVLALSGVYHEGPKRKRAFIGGLIGGVLVISMYALLPIDLRFSRMITLLGSVLVPLALLVRYGRSKRGKVYVISQERVPSALATYDAKSSDQVHDLDSHHEAIWNMHSTRLSDMIKAMKSSSCRHRFYDRVADATWSSYDSTSEGTYAMTSLPITITSSIHQLQKRLWDVLIALLLLVLSIVLPLLWRRSAILKIKELLLGSRTLIGYDESLALQLPETKPYLITCYPDKAQAQGKVHQALRYTTNYSILDDIYLTLTSPLRIISSLM